MVPAREAELVPGDRDTVDRMQNQDVRVLGIQVTDELLERWLRWFAPDPQPLLVQGRGHATVPAELRDTFELYALRERGLSVRWLTESEYLSLDRRERAALVRSQVELGRGLVPTADRRRFLWWPSTATRGALAAFVTGTRPPSRHGKVPWTSVGQVLPGARSIAGTFPSSSGPNCFGAVMAAAGVADAAETWMQREPFERWLAAAATPTTSRDPDSAGVVLVWRDREGAAEHAAVTLGSGWALHKPSQGWMSPTVVLPVAALIRSVRRRGLRLHRAAIRYPA